MTSAGSAGTAASTCWPPEVRTGTPGKARPSSSAVRAAPVTSARRRSDPHRGQAQSAARAPHQRQPGISLRAADLQRAAAHGAPGLRAAPAAGDRGQVAAPGHLDQDRPGGARARARCGHRRPGRCGRCAAPGSAGGRSWPPRPGPARPRRARPGPAASPAGGRPGGRSAAGPTRPRPAGSARRCGRSRRSGRPPRTGARAAPGPRGRSGTARGVRRAGRRRRPRAPPGRGRQTGANIAALVPATTRTSAAADGQPAAVALGRAEVGGQADVAPGAGPTPAAPRRRGPGPGRRARR